MELRDNIEAIEETQQIRPVLGVGKKFVIKREALFIRKHDIGPEANWTKRACLLSCCFDIIPKLDEWVFQSPWKRNDKENQWEFPVLLWTCFA
jgi:hypothetical protein